MTVTLNGGVRELPDGHRRWSSCSSSSGCGRARSWWSATARRCRAPSSTAWCSPTGTGWSWCGRSPRGGCSRRGGARGRRGAAAGGGPRLADARLYLCTDSRRRRGDLAEFLEAALRGGVDIVQLREKGLEAREELALLEVVADAARRHGALWSVNDRADLAAAAGADVLHLGQDDLPVPAARRLVGRRPAGRPVHPRPGPGRRGRGRAGRGLLLRRPDLADADQAGPPGARAGPDPVRGRHRDPALVRDRRDRPGPAGRGARRRGHAGSSWSARSPRPPTPRRRGAGRLPGAARDEAPDVPRRAGRLPARHAAAGDRAAHPGVRALAALAARARPDRGRVRRSGTCTRSTPGTGPTTCAG